MHKFFAPFVFVKRHLDYVIAGMILFILFSVQEVWDNMIGDFKFDHLVFVVIILLLVIVCVATRAEKKRFFQKWLRKNIWVACFTVMLFVSALLSTDLQNSLILLPRCLSGIFIVYIIAVGEFTYDNIRRMFGIVTLGMLVTFIYAIMQAIQGVAPNKAFTDMTVHGDLPGRIVAFFDNPNVYGFAVAALLPIAAAYTLGGKTRLRTILGIVSFVLGAAALILTYSRGAWLGFAMGAFFFAALCKPKLIPVIILLGLIAFPFIPAHMKSRILSAFNLTDSSVTDRGMLFEAGWNLIKSRPIFGAGLGLEPVRNIVLEHYWPPEFLYRFPHTHNLFLQIWCEMGIAGVITFFGMIIHAIARAVRSLKTQSKAMRMFVVGMISGVVALVFCGVADYPLSYSRIMLLFYILFGLLCAVKTGNNDELTNR